MRGGGHGKDGRKGKKGEKNNEERKLIIIKEKMTIMIMNKL